MAPERRWFQLDISTLLSVDEKQTGGIAGIRARRDASSLASVTRLHQRRGSIASELLDQAPVDQDTLTPTSMIAIAPPTVDLYMHKPTSVIIPSTTNAGTFCEYASDLPTSPISPFGYDADNESHPSAGRFMAYASHRERDNFSFPVNESAPTAETVSCVHLPHTQRTDNGTLNSDGFGRLFLPHFLPDDPQNLYVDI